MFYSPGLTWFDIFFGILFVSYFLYKFFSFITKKVTKIYKQYSYECWKEKNQKYIPLAHAYIYCNDLEISWEQFDPPAKSFSDPRWREANRKLIMDTCKKIKHDKSFEQEAKHCYDDTTQRLGHEPCAWRYEYL